MAHDQLERIAALDLTGLDNRRFGIQRLEEELSRVARDDSSLALILFDIDHFKRVNDSYGHLTGDRVIRRLAKVALESVRKGDVLVRYGGEEFFALLPGASIGDATTIAERIRHMSEEAVCHEQGHQVRFTVSLGCACSGQRCDSAEVLLRTADEALYAAKRAGRNRTVAAGSSLLPDSPQAAPPLSATQSPRAATALPPQVGVPAEAGIAAR